MRSQACARLSLLLLAFGLKNLGLTETGQCQPNIFNGNSSPQSLLPPVSVRLLLGAELMRRRTHGTSVLQLRGGRAPYSKGRPGKDPPVLDPVSLFDSFTGGIYSKHVNDDSEEAERTEDHLQEKDPNRANFRRFGKRSTEDMETDEVEPSVNSSRTEEELESEPDALELASKACLEGKLDEAAQGFEQCLQDDPEDAQAINNYATMLFHHKLDVDKAESLLLRALDLQPNCTGVMGNLALLLLDHREKREDEVEQLFKRILAVDPDDLAALNNYALFLQNVRKNYTGAEELLLHAEQVDRDFILTLANYIYLLHHHLPDKRYVEDRPDVDGPHYNMTGAELARALTLRALRTNGAHPWVQANAAKYLSKDTVGYQRYRARYPGHRPSSFRNVQGYGVVRVPSRQELVPPDEDAEME